MTKENNDAPVSTNQLLQEAILQNKQITRRADKVIERADRSIERADKSLERSDTIIEQNNLVIKSLHEKDALIGQVIHQNNVIIENLGEMRDKVNLIPSIIERLDRMEADSKIFRIWHKEHFKKSDNQAARLSKLEAAQA